MYLNQGVILVLLTNIAMHSAPDLSIKVVQNIQGHTILGLPLIINTSTCPRAGLTHKVYGSLQFYLYLPLLFKKWTHYILKIVLIRDLNYMVVPRNCMTLT